MAKYIDKSALVAEITKIYDRNRSNGFIDVCDEIDDILSLLDTLEVKDIQEEPVNEDERAKEAFCKATCNGHPPRSTCTSLGTCKEYDNFVKFMERKKMKC